MKTPTRTLFLAAVVANAFVGRAPADELWSSYFDVYNGIADGQQYQSGNTLEYNASVAGWTSDGFHAAHAVQVGSGDWALMVYSGPPDPPNCYTLNTGFAANEAGTPYWVSYEVAPAVYQSAGQATRDTDLLQVNVLNPENQVVASTTVAPGAWEGTETFHQEYFSYVGDGSGDVRLQITSGNPDSGYFAGAIYQIAFWDSQPTAAPEPSACALLGLGALGALWKCRRHQ